jgi:protease I
MGLSIIFSLIFLPLKVEKPLEGKNILFIIAHKGFNDKEYSFPRSMFERLGAEVLVASSDTTVAEGMYELKVKPDTLLTQIEEVNFDAIVFVGGVGVKKYWDDEKAHEIVKKAFEGERVKVIGAICIAPIILARAGILKWREATVWTNAKTKFIFKEEQVRYVGKPVVTSGKIVTANSPTAAKGFAEEIVRLLLQEKGKTKINIVGSEYLNDVIKVEILSTESLVEKIKLKVKIQNIGERTIRSMEMSCILHNEDGDPVGVSTRDVIRADNTLAPGEDRLFEYIVDVANPKEVIGVSFKIKKYIQHK